MRPVPGRLLSAAIVSAILLDLPFPIAGPLPLWRTAFAWFALIPLLTAVLHFSNQQHSRSRKSAFLWSLAAGWLTGAIWFGANCYWVYDTMHLYGGMNGPLAALSLVLFSLYLGFWFGAFSLTVALIRRATSSFGHAWLGFASIPFVWTAMEYALAQIPKFPWDLLGYSQVDNALLMRLAPWTGVYGISFLIVAVNALFATAFVVRTSPKGRTFSVARYCAVLGCVILFVCPIGLGNNPPKPMASTIAVLIQPNLDVANDDVWVESEWNRQIAQFAALSKKTCNSYLIGLPDTRVAAIVNQVCVKASSPSLVIWPESPAPFHDNDPRFRSAMATIARSADAPLIVGDWGDDAGPSGQYQIYNAASIVTKDGRFAGRYDKIHLVPFGEYVPLRSLLFFARRLTQNLTDLSTGKERRVFRIGSAPNSHLYGIFICYESVFGDEIRQFAKSGAEVLVNISDDGWYGDTSAPWQHLNMARMRAIENRRWILRATNNGTTASIDPYGAVRQSIPRHQVNALSAQYGFNSEITFYTAHGDVLPILCAILTLALLAWSGRKVILDTDAKVR